MLKAIINQTRSIGNEFLVINIKVQNRRVRHRAVGCAQEQGCTRCFSPAGQNQHQQEKERKKKQKREPQLQPC